MKISASVINTAGSHSAAVATNENKTGIEIPAKSTGRGSGINGGELLFLSLATCYCNDIFREADGMGIEVKIVEVNVEGEFEGKGGPASQVNYDVKISANAPQERINDLLRHTDSVAEIQNTLRIVIPVNLRRIEIIE